MRGCEVSGINGTPNRQVVLHHTFNSEELIEADHPLRPIKRMVDHALTGIWRAFKAAYSEVGRAGTPPEALGADEGIWRGGSCNASRGAARSG